uniref:RNA polymerase III subunit Rpc25 domain-containing protein n=1 Tax=Neobodo designis TaxID=312471 RepID=A0A7S1R0A1_NEODS|mmetsp:Transcript_5960/g.18819  ORF Transcript_5960/g.18819 Transcript_5960/m.18819 type:complete len:250 (+) Transcript_5960:71-820(+)
MFELLEVQDLIELRPDAMPTRVVDGMPLGDDSTVATAVEASIQSKYAFKVIAGANALCVGVGEVCRVGLARLAPGSPSAWVGVTFNLVVFRPRTNERLKGRIARQDAHGVYLTLDFFDHIIVPAHLLKEPSEFDAARRRWRYVADEGGDGAKPSYAEYVDGEAVTFAVHAVIEGASELERTQAAAQAMANEKGAASSGAGANGADGGKGTLPGSLAMTVQASFVDPGLGPVAWFELDAGADADDSPAAA